MVQAISRGITKSGVGVTTVNLELATLDEVTATVKESDGFIIGARPRAAGAAGGTLSSFSANASVDARAGVASGAVH